MNRANVVEFGAWALLVAAVAWLAYVLIHKAKIVTTKVGGQFVGASVDNNPVPPQDPVGPLADTSFDVIDTSRNVWTWHPRSKQWTISERAV